ncbi:hypothetical protein FDECE_18464, partial [Fusarium decemcellulare]
MMPAHDRRGPQPPSLKLTSPHRKVDAAAHNREYLSRPRGAQACKLAAAVFGGSSSVESTG